MARTATKKQTATTKVKSANSNLVKDLKPSAVDAKYFGPEPNFVNYQPNDVSRSHDLTHAFNWYSRFYSLKEAKQFIVSYLKLNGKETAIKKITRVPDHSITSTYGWLARMSIRGLVLTESEASRLNNEINRLIALVEESSNASPDEAQPERSTNIQELMKERAAEAAGEIEGLFDDYIREGSGKVSDTKNAVIGFLNERKVLPQHIKPLIDHWQSTRNEFTDVQAGKCEQLSEAYSHLSKIQVKSTVKFIDSILADLNGYIALKNASRKPRARKAVPVEKVVAKLKYCKNYKDDFINLTSVPPTKLHNCSEAWVYDTKKRKIHHYIADEYSKVLTVKGNAVYGFDKVTSGVKTLRKPAEQIKELTGSKPAARKYFKNIKAVETVPNGRFNENMVILKAF